MTKIVNGLTDDKNKKMENRNKVIFLLLGITFLLSICIVSGATLEADNITVSIPGASAIMSGTAVFNCTIITGYETENWTRIRPYFVSASLTANTTATPIAWTLNQTDELNLNGTINTAIVEDGNDYTFTCELWNGTHSVNKSRTGITIDNTVPTAPTSLIPTSNPNSSVVFSGTVTGSRTTSCVLYFDGRNPGFASYSMTHTGDTCTYTHASVPEETYNWYIRASDESNTTDSNVQTTNVDIDTSSNYLFQGDKDITVSDDGTLSVVGNKVLGLPVWLIGLIVVLVIAFVIAKRK